MTRNEESLGERATITVASTGLSFFPLIQSLRSFLLPFPTYHHFASDEAQTPHKYVRARYARTRKKNEKRVRVIL